MQLLWRDCARQAVKFRISWSAWCTFSRGEQIRGYVPRENEHRGAHFRGWCTNSLANLCAGARLRGGNEYAVTPAPRGKIESVRTHSKVIEQFDSFSLLKLLFLVRNWHCWSRKAFLAKWHPKAEKKLWKRRFFDTADRHERLYGRSRLYASAQGRHETGGVSFAFFETFLWHFNKNSVQRWSSDFQGLFRVKIRKMAQEAMISPRSP